MIKDNNLKENTPKENTPDEDFNSLVDHMPEKMSCISKGDQFVIPDEDIDNLQGVILSAFRRVLIFMSVCEHMNLEIERTIKMMRGTGISRSTATAAYNDLMLKTESNGEKNSEFLDAVKVLGLLVKAYANIDEFFTETSTISETS